MNAASKAAEFFIKLPFFATSTRFAAYLATPTEFDASILIEQLWQHHKECYVPHVSDVDQKSLIFVRYRQGDALHFNQYKILEPIQKTNVIPPEQLDVVLLPLLAFDQLGHRLGTGGGFYDKAFAFLNERHDEKTKDQKPLMIGVAFAMQEVEELPSDDWDIHLDGVITEKGFIDCSKSNPITHE